MDAWPLYEAEYKEVGKYFGGRYRAYLAEPLVDYVQSNRLDWHEIAPSPPFSYAVVHLWSTGARTPNQKHITTIKHLNGLSDADLPIQDKAVIETKAKADTLTWIQGRWFAGPGDAAKVITPLQVMALDIAVKLLDTQLNREGVADWVGILEAIRASVPRAEVWTLTDLTKLREDWMQAHGGFNDADIDGHIPHEY